MKTLPLCRVCLSENVQYLIENTQLQIIYEKLTSTPLQTDDMRPRSVCYICHAQLQTAYKFMMKCLKAENFLTQMLEQLQNSGDKVDLQTTIIDKWRPNILQYSRSIVEHCNVESKVEYAVKQEIKSEQDDEMEDIRGTAHISPPAAATDNFLPQSETIEFENSDIEIIDSDIETDSEKIEASEIKLCEEYIVPIIYDKSDYEGDNSGMNQILSNDNPNKFNEIITHTINKSFEIPLLEEIKTQPKSLNMSYICTICQKQFQTESSLIIHTKRHAVEKHQMIKKDILNTHARSDTDQIYTCDKCLQSFTNKSDIESHMADHSDEKPYTCNLCQRRFIHKHSLELHMRCHTGERPYTCNICQKTFDQKQNLIAHVRLHGFKPYTCDVCHKNFTHKRNLIGHARIHTQLRLKPYSCDVCQKGYDSEYNLIRHGRIHTGEKAHTCHVCQKSFIHRSRLAKHAKIHSGEKPFACDVCEKRFSEKRVLVMHERIHTGDKPYSCTVCDKSFTQKCSLARHARTHTGEKPYTCRVCQRGFSENNSLKRHIKIHPELANE